MMTLRGEGKVRIVELDIGCDANASTDSPGRSCAEPSEGSNVRYGVHPGHNSDIARLRSCAKGWGNRQAACGQLKI